MTERTTSLVNPRYLPSRERIQAIADRAQGIEPPQPAAPITALSKRKRKSSSPTGRSTAPAARAPAYRSERAASHGEAQPRPGLTTSSKGPGGAESASIRHRRSSERSQGDDARPRSDGHSRARPGGADQADRKARRP